MKNENIPDNSFFAFCKVSAYDDGPGVPKECLEQIFDSFYRVDDSRNSAEKGSGIGLEVVKEIILGHG